ncbi:hypothetical protein [Streptacidiphilus monticola]|jgi:hypothetical protein|uniref:Ankyrin repeat domain-containing protein n=1 Tax=Streptacidiphilus monticola TaxID=2161674 RepID=A0ABW1G597_9ACTN
MSVTWSGYGSRSTLKPQYLAERDALADAARDGDWETVLRIVGENAELANSSRVGGSSGYTPLHQAAWHGAPEPVVERLLAAGAWRTLRTTGGDAAGERACDVASRRGHRQLASILVPRPRHPVPEETASRLRAGLHEVILGRVADLVREHVLRLPEVEPLTELEEPGLWFPVPGFYGGFSIELRLPDGESAESAELEVSSWCRVWGGSGQRHRVAVDGVELVEEGFV